MKKIILIVGIVVGAVCLYMAFRGISLGQVALAIRSANPAWIALAMGVYTFGYFFRSLRWSILMRPLQELSARELYSPMMLGWFANNVLPFRMGELVRAYIAAHKFNITVSASLGTILLERLFDMFAFLTTFLIAAFFFPFPKSVEQGAAALGGLCLLVTIALLIVSSHQKRFHDVINRFPAIPEAIKTKVIHIVSNFSQGIGTVKNPQLIFKAASLSIIVWCMEGSVLYCFGRAFDVGMGYPAAFFLLFFMGLSVMLPQAPGYVGTMEWFGVSAMVLLGIPKEQGLPVILTVHASTFLYICLVGLWALWHEGLTMNSIFAVEKKAEKEIE